MTPRKTCPQASRQRMPVPGRAGHKSVLEGVLDLVGSPLGLARDLVGASFSFQPPASGDPADTLLGLSPGRLGLMAEPLKNAHGAFLIPGLVCGGNSGKHADHDDVCLELV